jgi:hypothetical protein
LAVVLRLVADVVGDFIELSLAHGESSIGPLPFKGTVDLMSYEMGGTAFDLFDKLRNCQGGWKSYEKMKMIFDPADRDDATV